MFNMDNITFLIGETFDLFGKLLIAYTAIKVHHRFWQEHKIDESVFKVMKREQKLGIAGMVLIFTGYVISDILPILGI